MNNKDKIVNYIIENLLKKEPLEIIQLNKQKGTKTNLYLFIELIISDNNYLTTLNISSPTFSRICNKLFKELLIQHKKATLMEKWKYYLLRLTKYKQCSLCKEYKFREIDFDIENQSNDKLNSRCKICRKNLREKDSGKIAGYARVYKANLAQAIPKWSQKEEINILYKGRKEGIHIDHIIPLKNDLVCGLHVIENLQYLTPQENRIKSNKFDIVKFNNL